MYSSSARPNQVHLGKVVQNPASIQFASSPLATLKLDSYRPDDASILYPSPTVQDVFFPWVRAHQYEKYKNTWYTVTYYSNGMQYSVPYCREK